MKQKGIIVSAISKFILGILLILLMLILVIVYNYKGDISIFCQNDEEQIYQNIKLELSPHMLFDNEKGTYAFTYTPDPSTEIAQEEFINRSKQHIFHIRSNFHLGINTIYFNSNNKEEGCMEMDFNDHIVKTSVGNQETLNINGYSTLEWCEDQNTVAYWGSLYNITDIFEIKYSKVKSLEELRVELNDISIAEINLNDSLATIKINWPDLENSNYYVRVYDGIRFTADDMIEYRHTSNAFANIGGTNFAISRTKDKVL